MTNDPNDERVLIDGEGGRYMWVGYELRKLDDKNNRFFDRSEHSEEAITYQMNSDRYKKHMEWIGRLDGLEY